MRTSIFYIGFLVCGCADNQSAETETETDYTSETTTTLSATSEVRTCTTILRYEPNQSVSKVALAGSFNGWSTSEDVMQLQADGSYQATVDLPAGNYPYKFVETVDFSYDQVDYWVCDPMADYAHCENGYKEPSDMDWAFSCESGENSDCNSLLTVPDCTLPLLMLDGLDVQHGDGDISVSFKVLRGSTGANITEVVAVNNDDSIPIDWEDGVGQITLSGLSAGFHHITVFAQDALGNQSETVTVPVWLGASPDESWQAGSVYWAFIDRVSNGDTANDAPQGTSHEISDYMGGDFAGLTNLLPYLDDLGVTVLWISNPQQNAPQAWDGDCDATYAGYHAYWPGEARTVQPQFGTSDELEGLVDAAHTRGMRVIMDWVGNHLHEQHPWVENHPDWFNSQALCNDSTHAGANWDTIPESCWFAPYLPDINYAEPDVLVKMVDEAMWWATAYKMDGFRVDAVKHMSHALHRNMNREIERRIEHKSKGGSDSFLTLGETFDGYDAITAYVSEDELDGQFDFPMYWTINDVFAYQTSTLDALVAANEEAEGRLGHARMSNFLGNHDVIRFTSLAAEGDVGVCWEDGFLASAQPPADSNVYDRLILAWSWLFTRPNPPTIYYGDELGMPGYTDPDNRQPLWWHTGGDLSGIKSVEDMAARVGADEARVLRAVKILANERRENPVFWRGETTEWWAQPMDAPNLLALARIDQESGGELILVMNRSWEEVTLTNGLSFAGLSTEGEWRDILSQQTFNATSDTLSFTMSPYQARLLLKE